MRNINEVEKLKLRIGARWGDDENIVWNGPTFIKRYRITLKLTQRILALTTNAFHMASYSKIIYISKEETGVDSTDQARNQESEKDYSLVM